MEMGEFRHPVYTLDSKADLNYGEAQLSEHISASTGAGSTIGSSSGRLVNSGRFVARRRDVFVTRNRT